MKPLTLVLALLAASLAVAALVFAPVKVTLDGKPLSSRGIVQNGVVYVPANDVARALGKSYAFDKKANVAKIGAAGGPAVPAGGANQADGVAGKAGEVIFNGVTRLTVGTSFEPGDPYTLLEMEARNAERANKTYHFGYTSTKYTLFDPSGNAVEGEMKNNDHYAVDLPQGQFRKFKVSFRMPHGFVPARLVIHLSTQVPGNPAKMEVFRVSF